MRPRDPDERDLAAVRSPETSDPDDVPLHRVGAVARSLTDEDHELHDPPPALWARIAATVAAEATGPGGVPPAADDSGGGGAGAGGDGASVVRPARWWRSTALLAAAAVVIVAGIVGAIVLAQDGAAGRVVVATVELEPLGDVTGVEGRLVEVDGHRELDMDADVAALPDPGGFYEVWLIDEDVEGMVSLGPMRADGTYEVPSDVDYRDYPIVDVSVEPDDGDPTHSGSSILRGTLSS